MNISVENLIIWKRRKNGNLSWKNGRVFVESSAFGKWERVKLVQRYIYSFLSPVWCTRVAALQGGVIAEPIYNKVEDFCFWSFILTGQVKWRLPDILFSVPERVECMKETTCSLMRQSGETFTIRTFRGFDGLGESFEVWELSKSVSSVYKGYLGVDMMICRFPENEKTAFRIHPCVEINLRMNMGVMTLPVWLLCTSGFSRMFGNWLSSFGGGSFEGTWTDVGHLSVGNQGGEMYAPAIYLWCLSIREKLLPGVDVGCSDSLKKEWCGAWLFLIWIHPLVTWDC